MSEIWSAIGKELSSAAIAAVAVAIPLSIFAGIDHLVHRKKYKNTNEKKKAEREQSKQLQKVLKEMDKTLRETDLSVITDIQKKMQLDCIKYLKAYVNKPEFKSKYKDYLYLIKITEQEYGDPFSIEICVDQSGIDSDRVHEWLDKHESEYDNDEDAWNACPYTKNDWYYELLDAGEKYLNEKYKNELQKYGMYINTGDGDECNIYICFTSHAWDIIRRVQKKQAKK